MSWLIYLVSNLPVSSDVGECTRSACVENCRREGWRVILKEAFDSSLLVVRHLEVIAEAASREDDLHTSALRVRNLAQEARVSCGR